MALEIRHHPPRRVERERAPTGEVTRAGHADSRPAAPELATQLEAATRGGGDRGGGAQVKRHYSTAGGVNERPTGPMSSSACAAGIEKN